MIEWDDVGEVSSDGRWVLNSETIRGEGRTWWVMKMPPGAREVADDLGIDLAHIGGNAKRTIQRRCQRIEDVLHDPV